MNADIDVAARLYPEHVSAARQQLEADRVRALAAPREQVEPEERLYGRDAVRRALDHGRDRSDDPVTKFFYYQAPADRRREP